MLCRIVRNAMVIVSFLTVLPGCGTSPHVVKVSGTVTRGGQPVDKLVVNYTPEEGHPSSGATADDGRYVLKYERGREGAVTGKHRVWVQVKVTNAKEEDELARGVLKMRPEIKAIIDKYGDEKTSPLTVEVTGNNQVIDLPLD